MKAEEVQENIVYPSILFKLKEGYFAIGSKNVASIMQMPSYEHLPQAPDNVVGIFKFRSNVIPIINLRTLFGLPSTDEEVSEFTSMLESRKQDHINWVKELNRCVKTGDHFTLAKDPHKCAFGRWYDHYETDNSSIRFHLNKLEEPHRLLHEVAVEAANCSQECDECARNECLKKTIEKAQNIYMPKIIELLDDAKELYDNLHHSMLIVIDTGTESFGLIVDEVLAVEELTDVAAEEKVEKLQGSKYISEIKKSARVSRLVLLLNDEKLSEISKNYRLQEEKNYIH